MNNILFVLVCICMYVYLCIWSSNKRKYILLGLFLNSKHFDLNEFSSIWLIHPLIIFKINNGQKVKRKTIVDDFKSNLIKDGINF